MWAQFRLFSAIRGAPSTTPTGSTRKDVRRLRDLLRLVAAELERLAGAEDDPQRRDVLLRRAMRIRERLHEAWPRG
jgi:hypothetical protein